MSIRPLSKELQEKAERELNEIPTQVQHNLQLYKSWLEKQEHLIYKNDDQFLLSFLRSSKYSLERAKAKLDGYYTFRTLVPEFARDMDPLLPDIQAHLTLSAAVCLPTPKDDPAAPRVLLVRYSDFNPDELPLCSMIKGELMANDILLNHDDNYVVSGATIIWDLSNTKIKMAFQATPSIVKKVVFYFENAFPSRLKAAYIINAPVFFERVLNLVMLFVSEKLAKRIHVYSSNNFEAIFEDIPKSIFPNEYGGEAGCYDDLKAEWKKTIESYREMLLEENSYYSDESKRPKKAYTVDDIFGIDGSFRTLEID